MPLLVTHLGGSPGGHDRLRWVWWELTVFGFADKGSSIGFASVVYGPSIFFGQESDTAALLRAFERLEELALSPEMSARLIRQIDKEVDHA